MAIHSREYLSSGDLVVVNCTHQSNVLVMDDTNFRAYQRGGHASYYGGFFTHFPARVRVPHAANWNVVLEAPDNARYGMSVVRN